MRRMVRVSALLALAACLDNSGPEDLAVARVEILGDTLLSGLPGDTLPGELSVLVTDHRGEPLRGVEVAWSTSDGGSFAPAVVPTNGDGIARTRWRLGIAPGAQTARALVLGVEDVRFEATAVGFTAVRLSTGTGPHTCALDDDGSAFCWGRNWGGELGDGTTNDSEVPVPVAGSLSFTQIVTGHAYQFAGFTCGLATSGEVYCWGSNSVGELGDGGSASMRLEPRPIAVPAGTRFTTLSAFYGGTCGVTTLGDAYCWGMNSGGRFGNGLAGGTAATPTLVAGNLRWQQVALGDDRACGISSDSRVYCWGGSLDLLGFDPALAPLTEPMLFDRGPVFDSLSVSAYSQCGTRAGSPHAGYCWGSAFHVGAIPRDFGYVTSPSVVAPPTLFRSIKASGSMYFGLSIDGHLYLWGNYWHDHWGPGAPVRMTTAFRLRAMGTNEAGACGIEDRTSTVYCWVLWGPGREPVAVPPASESGSGAGANTSSASGRTL